MSAEAGALGRGPTMEHRLGFGGIFFSVGAMLGPQSHWTGHFEPHTDWFATVPLQSFNPLILRMRCSITPYARTYLVPAYLLLNTGHLPIDLWFLVNTSIHYLLVLR